MRYRFEDYRPENESQERALKIARSVSDIAVKYADETVTTSPAIVVFSGSPGVGKTHLIESIKTDLSDSGINFESFSGQIPHHRTRGARGRIIVGDDAFSRHEQLNGTLGSSCWSEVQSLNEHLLEDWYPDGSLVILGSNFDLPTIQQALRASDGIGRASSRLDEMARRGADVPILGPDHRSTSEIASLFEW